MTNGKRERKKKTNYSMAVIGKGKKRLVATKLQQGKESEPPATKSQGEREKNLMQQSCNGEGKMRTPCDKVAGGKGNGSNAHARVYIDR